MCAAAPPRRRTATRPGRGVAALGVAPTFCHIAGFLLRGRHTISRVPRAQKRARKDTSVMAFIADRLSRIKPSPTNAAQGKFLEMKAAGKDGIGLPAGEPDFPTPDHVQEAAIKALRDHDTKHTPVPGTPALRQAISAKLKRD